MPKISLFISLAAVFISWANLRAAYINVPVPNYSFELPGTSKQLCWDAEKTGSTNVPGWSSDFAALNSGVEMAPGSTNGNWIAFLMGREPADRRGLAEGGQDSSDPSIWNLLPHVIRAGDEFFLTVDARNNQDAAVLKMSFYYLDDDGKRITVATKIVALTGSFRTYFLRFAVDDAPSCIGHALGIELENPSTGWLGIDNVQVPQSNVPNSVGRSMSFERENPLMAGTRGIPASAPAPTVIIPEPSTIALLCLGGLMLLFKRH